MKILQTYWVVIPWWTIRKIFMISLYTFFGAVTTAVIVFIFYLQTLPELSLWHTVQLKNRFTSNSNINDFAQYRALEDKIFKELDEKIYKILPSAEQSNINRYTHQSLSDPDRWPIQWNRSVEFPVENAKVGVLLLHGMSDSPYSLNAQARYLNKRGVYTLVMRMPGHGTIPSGLIELTWQDMAAAVRIGMKHLKEKMGDKPIYMMGYSTGAPLALNYTFSSLTHPSLTTPEGLIFYSPAIGVTKAASMAVWQGRLGHILGIEKLEWNDITPEYDPFKYGSFAINAGDLVYRLSLEVQRQFNQLASNTETYKKFPPVLSFASVVDATVSVTATVNDLYNKLPKNRHTLVLFDLNNDYAIENLLRKKSQKLAASLLSLKKGDHYTLQLITNTGENITNALEEITINDTGTPQYQALGLQWPEGIYSLSHLAMPVRPNDPLYGQKAYQLHQKINLGSLAAHGERNVLQISASALLRQRWNPFHSYTKQKVTEFMKLTD